MVTLCTDVDATLSTVMPRADDKVPVALALVSVVATVDATAAVGALMVAWTLTLAGDTVRVMSSVRMPPARWLASRTLNSV